MPTTVAAMVTDRSTMGARHKQGKKRNSRLRLVHFEGEKDWRRRENKGGMATSSCVAVSEPHGTTAIGDRRVVGARRHEAAQGGHELGSGWHKEQRRQVQGGTQLARADTSRTQGGTSGG
ncbi:hypothetical protein OsI_02798 [Oryza sativa Indica Group]|uniref:Uncharacterized protein n=1 Tax=Oryza sativa subsp. indica TaxID=39946 RepID=B8ABK0_ORYSI|nr:hypothetical protein OsI_02798 [Oryza sativa Indica Group]